MSLDEGLPPHASRRDALCHERDRSGVGPFMLLDHANNPPIGLNAHMIARWLTGETRAARRAYFDFALQLWRSITPEDRRKLTKRIVAELAHHRKRTGIGPKRLLAGSSGIPEGLNADTIRNWMAGLVRTAETQYLDFVLDTWRTLPDAGIVEVNAAIRNELIALRERSGVGPAALLRNLKTAPEDLSAWEISCWMKGTRTEARQEYLDFVLDAWRNAPPQTAVDRGTRRTLSQMQSRSRITPSELLKDRDDTPDDLNAGTIVGWMTGAVRKARKDHLDYVLRLWAACPDYDPGCEDTREDTSAAGEDVAREKSEADDALRLERAGWKAVSPDVRRKLGGLKARSALDPSALLRGRKDKPKGLTAIKIEGWLDGSILKARPEHLDYVLALWSEAPSWITIPKEIRQEMKAHLERAGLKPEALLRTNDKPPAKLHPRLIEGWLTGEIKMAYEDRLDYVLRLCQALPQVGAPGTKDQGDPHSAS